MKYDWRFKLKCVEDYKKGRWTEKPDNTSCPDQRFHKKIRLWVRVFDLHGIDGLKHSSFNKDWTAEERYELVAQVLAGRSVTSVAVEAGINDGQLYHWVRRYKENGYDGLQLRKGRNPREPAMNANRPDELTKSEREELILLRRQNEYLKTENAYLKKLKALTVRKKARSSVKAKKQHSSENSENRDTD